MAELNQIEAEGVVYDLRDDGAVRQDQGTENAGKALVIGPDGKVVPKAMQEKTATPQTTAQTVTADEGYGGLASVEVAGIPYREESNSAGGTTVVIG